MNSKTKFAWLCVALAIPAAFSVTSAETKAQDVLPVLPSPKAFVGNLDLACHKVEGGVTPMQSVLLNHLNPVLDRLGFHREQAQLGALEQLCVPVAKNERIPPRDVLPFVESIDLACYAAASPDPQPAVQIRLSQLNPVVQRLGLPDHLVQVGKLRQLCTPVAKNGKIPTGAVLALARNLDVACYDVKVDREFAPPPLRLSNLNPVLKDMGLPIESARLNMPEQLCVPVTKNNAVLPDAIARIVRWVDFEKFPVSVVSIGPAAVPLRLTHLNPLFAPLVTSASFDIRLGPTTHLDLPVAKNGQFPPL